MSRRTWSLRRKLVVGIGALIATAFLITSITTILALRSFAIDRLDEKVLDSLEFAVGPDDAATDDEDLPGDGSFGPPGGGSLSDGPAPRVGSLQVVLDSDGAAVSSSYIRSDGEELDLTSEAIQICIP